MVYHMSDDEIFSELYDLFCTDDLIESQEIANACKSFYEEPKSKMELSNLNVIYPITIEEHIEQMNNFKIKQVESIMDTLNFETLKKLSKIIDRAERWTLSSGCN